MEKRLVFNEDAGNYERLRPAYVPELFSDIIRYSDLDETKRALEVGIGTGQATLPFLNSGCSVTAIEIGKELTEYSRRKFSGYKNFEVLNSDFESLSAESRYELIYSATAFHWIPIEIGYPKAFELLKQGGTLALFWNHPFVNREDEPVHREIQKSYAKYWPSAGEPLREFSEKDCERLIKTLSKYGFRSIEAKLYFNTRTFSAEDYISLLDTYSDHRFLPEDTKIGLYKDIREGIEKFGGIIRIYDTMDLYLAKR